MLAAEYVIVDDEPEPVVGKKYKSQKETRNGTSETDGREKRLESEDEARGDRF